MTLKQVMEASITEKIAFKRPSWHYWLWFEPMLGYYTDGYNASNCSFLSIEDAVAEDYILFDENQSEP